MRITIGKGMSFYEAFNCAKEMMKLSGSAFAEFEFNDVQITVQRDSVFPDIAEIYDLKRVIQRLRGN